jgi:periplasmic nitrate reductase NapD
MIDNEPLHIASAVVLSQVDKVESVKSSLASIAGIEVHNESNDGRIVITVESPQYREVADMLLSIRDIEGVLSSELVYQYSDGDKVSDGDKAH